MKCEHFDVPHWFRYDNYQFGFTDPTGGPTAVLD